MEHTIRKRIDRMFFRDKRMAQIALLLLWVTFAYVYFAITSQTTDTSVQVALSIGAGAVLIFNSASILAMIRHYAEDKDHIYGLDIRHLDENRAAKAELAKREEEALSPVVE
ncbi:hypothetical protein VSR68_38710 [Paraburkholderia phymatum]|uniref:hypothetical protein n=1 Tax=Paraburkholderia phymatum TaxID=148447 RepID=UPI00316C32C6